MLAQQGIVYIVCYHMYPGFAGTVSLLPDCGVGPNSPLNAKLPATSAAGTIALRIRIFERIPILKLANAITPHFVYMYASHCRHDNALVRMFRAPPNGWRCGHNPAARSRL